MSSISATMVIVAVGKAVFAAAACINIPRKILIVSRRGNSLLLHVADNSEHAKSCFKSHMRVNVVPVTAVMGET